MAGRTTREAWAKLRVNGVKVPRDLRKAESGFRKGGRRAGLAFRRGFRRVVGRLRGAAGMLGGIGIGVGIGAGLAKGLQDASQFEDQLQRLGSQARKFGSEMDVVRKSITKTSDETGLARSELTGALDEMVNLEGGSALTARNLETLAKGMQGTGTDGRELAQVMFTLGSNMKIAQDEMQGVLGGIDRIGTEASVPFSQLAASYTEVAAAASRMGVSGPQGVFQTVAAMQAMRKEITTPDEIKTSFTNLVTELLKKRKQIKRAFKIDVATGKGENTKLRDLFDIIQDFSQLDMSDAQRTLAITDVFGKRTAKGAIALLNNFKDFERFVSIGNEGAVEDFLGVRAQERAESAAGKLDAAINRLKLAFAEAFTPELIENVASAVGDVASGVNAAIDALRELKNFVSGDNTNDLVGDVG
jgi:TP901 family phage tail tape measure protein